MVTRLLNSARNASLRSQNKNYCHGASISLGGKILVSVPNGTSMFCHAEILAIKELCKKISFQKRKKCKLMVVRTFKSGLCDSKPCKMCSEVIKASGIKRVIYSDNKGKLSRFSQSEKCVFSKGIKNLNDDNPLEYRRFKTKVMNIVKY